MNVKSENCIVLFQNICNNKKLKIILMFKNKVIDGIYLCSELLIMQQLK